MHIPSSEVRLRAFAFDTTAVPLRPNSRVRMNSMTPRKALHGNAVRPRAGFTLLEMLAVILIIAILIAVAFPAYTAVMTNARIATAKSEMATVSTSIAEFKSKFNVEPPSYISFVGASPAALPASTKAMLRQMFPQIDLSAGSPVMGSLATAGIWGKEVKGSEALVFFLGGVRLYDTAASELTNELIGFSKNPMNPFAQPAPGQSNRLGPFFEFDSSRLVDTEATPDNLLEYVDKLPGQSKPLLYLSTARTGGYVKSDVEGVAAAWEPYKKSATTYWNPNTFQIISPGFDGDYGVGGVYDSANTAQLAPGEVDNLTNFHEGRLGG